MTKKFEEQDAGYPAGADLVLVPREGKVLARGRLAGAVGSETYPDKPCKPRRATDSPLAA